MVPLRPLTKLASHEQELLSRLAPHVTEEQPQLRQLLRFRPRHLRRQRALHVDDLVVRERQHEPFAVGVEHAEGQLVVVVSAVNRLAAHIPQRVVHPPHVPLVVETKPTQVVGPSDARP